MVIPFFISMLLLITGPAPAAGRAASVGRTDDEAGREVVDEMNLVRRDPAAYAEKYLRPRRKFYQGKEYELSPSVRLVTEEGVGALDECLEALARAKSAPALAWSDGLARAARDHVKDQGKSGETGHEGSDGSRPHERAERYGSWKRTIGENIGYGNNVPREIVIQLLIDDGVPGRGHRSNILNPQFRTAGAAIGPHKEFRFMCVMDFAGGFIERKAKP